jgi:NOL1/NOP2/fmu family ribosome biogenesis protein
MKLDKYSGSQFVLSHEFISRFGSKFLNGLLAIEDDYINQWLSDRDIRHFKSVDFPYGSVVVIRDLGSRILGGGKILPDRIRNLLPPRLVN